MKLPYLAMAGPALAALVKQDWVLTWEIGAPNGQPREMIKINGQFPGPALHADEDDDIEVGSLAQPDSCR